MGTLVIMYTILQNVLPNHSKIFWKVYLAIFLLIFITAVILAILASICDVLSLKYIKPTNFASCRWLSAFLPMTSKKAKIEELQTSIASKWQASTNKRRERKSQMSKKLKKIFLIYQFINVFSKYLRITQCFLSVMNPLFIKYMQSSTSLWEVSFHFLLNLMFCQL